MLTTVHSYTASQKLQDAPSKDLRRSQRPPKTLSRLRLAAIAVTKTLPQLTGKFDGLSVRVPTPVVSLGDVTALLRKDVTVEQVNDVQKSRPE